MSIGSIISWILCGLVVGLCARFLVPGRQSMSLLMTTLLGIAGAGGRVPLFPLPGSVSGTVLLGQPQLVRLDRGDSGGNAPRMDLSPHVSPKVVELTKEHENAWYYSACDSHFAALGCVADLVSQPELGLYAERRTWINRRHTHRPLADRTALIVTPAPSLS